MDPDWIKVFLVEDHPVVRHGLKRLIETETDMRVCGEAEGVAEAFDGIRATEPDIALIDLALNDGSGMDLIGRVALACIDIKMIVVSTFDAAAYAPGAIQAGAMGYVNKHEAIDQIIHAIRAVLGGKHFVDNTATQPGSGLD